MWHGQFVDMGIEAGCNASACTVAGVVGGYSPALSGEALQLAYGAGVCGVGVAVYSGE